MSVIWGTGQSRPPREVAIIFGVGAAGALLTWAFCRAIDLALFTAWWGWGQ